MPSRNQFEFKSPSYELREPRVSPAALSAKTPRFRCDQDVWSQLKPSQKGHARIIIAGDLLCQENMIDGYRTSHGGFDFSLCFSQIEGILNSSDLAIGNLETPIDENAPYRGEIITHEGPFYCNAPLEYLAALRNAGFDALTTANNHTLDAGYHGLVATIDNARELGFIQTGTFKNAGKRFCVVDVCGIRVGLTAFSFTYNRMDWNLKKAGRTTLLNTYSDKLAKTILKEMRDCGVEYAICFPHWGKEYSLELNEKQIDAASSLTRMGYDCIIGSHPHVLQKFDYVNKKPVAYSVGNLISHLNLVENRRNAQYTTLCALDLSKNSSGNVSAQVKFIPCRIAKDIQGAPFVVLPATPSPLDQAGDSRETQERVAALLNVDESMFELSAPHSSYAIGSQTWNDAVNNLASSPKHEHNVTLPSTLIPEDICRKLQEHGYSPETCTLQNNCLITVENNVAEALGWIDSTTVARIPKTVNEKPVRKASNCLGELKNTRIVYVGANVRTIADRAFAGSPLLESARLFTGLESIGTEAFADCPRLTGIIIPDSTTSISSRAFANCPKLLSVKIPPSVVDIASDAFEDSPKIAIFGERGSFAEVYAKQHGISFTRMPLTREGRIGARLSIDCRKDRDRPLPTPSSSDHLRLPQVKMGPMNGPHDPHPATIRSVCAALGAPLPQDAVCAFAPSHYLGADRFSGYLGEINYLLKDKMPHVSYRELKRRYRNFVEEYRMQKTMRLTTTDLTVYFADYIMYAWDRGFGHHCYFVYELYNKEPEVRDTFLNAGYRRRVAKACTPTSLRHLFSKREFNALFPDYVQRDWLVSQTCSFEEFEQFVHKHPRFFAKLPDGAGGAGARVVDASDRDVAEVYRMCRSEKLVCEELIQQCDELAEFNASTLNTVRVTTLLCADGTPRITLATARFGRSGNVADNFHSGGVGAVVDIESGVIISEAIDMYHQRSPVHPDSGKAILGFQYPMWDEIKKAVLDCAKRMPETRHIGWDIAITKNHTIEYVEGNCLPGFDVMQSPDQVGRKFMYEPYLFDIERLAGITPTKLDPIVIQEAKPIRDELHDPEEKPKKKGLFNRLFSKR